MLTVDESQPNTDLKQIRHLRRIYLAIAVILWYVITYGLFERFVGPAFIYGENSGIYWLVFHQTPSNIAAIIPVVAILAALIIPGFLLEKYPSLLLSGVILFILFVVLIAALTLFGPRLPSIQHIQTMQYGGHTYHLADRAIKIRRVTDSCLPPDPADYDPDCFPGYFTHEYMVYQCGQKGVVCHNIVYEAFEEHKYSSEGRLFIDSQGNMVLSVDGRMVWTYPEDDQ